MWRCVAVQLERLPAVSGDGLKRIVVDFRAGDDRNLIVEQLGELTNDAALRLAAQSEQDDVVLRENRVDELGNDGFVVADDAGKEFFAALQFLDEIGAQLVFDRDASVAALLLVRRKSLASSHEVSWTAHRETLDSKT